MSRRKQTNPFKVNWPFHATGFSGPRTALEMEAKDDYGDIPACHSGNCQDLDEQDDITDDSDSDLDRENSSNSSADDSVACHKGSQCSVYNGEMKQESDIDADMVINYTCPLCNLEFSGTEQLIAHVYQHTSTVGDSRSYVCPVCGRALSTPGSLGRHLLIHSDDRLSNCAVCGARFNDTANVNREKLHEFLTHSDLGCRGQDDAFPDDRASMPRVNHDSGAALPPLPDSPAPPSASPPSFPDPLSQLPDLLGPAPVYPADVLLVCNACAAFQRLADAHSSGAGRWAGRRRNEPSEARVQRLERERVAKRSKRDRETPEEREMRRLRDREAKRMQRLQETQEQRARRLQRDREAMRLKRATETPERRQARLVREREAKRLKRRLEKIEPGLRVQIGHDPVAGGDDVGLFQFPYNMPVSTQDNRLFMKLP